MTMTPTTAFSGDNYWPDGMSAEEYYQPSPRGFEAKVAERLAFWAEKRREKQSQSD